MVVFYIKLTTVTVILLTPHLILCSHGAGLHAGRRMLGHVIRTEHHIPFNECMRLCENVVDCLSVNYFRKTHFCELNAQIVDTDEKLVEAPGYVYKEKILSDNVCSRAKCLTGDVCGTNDTCNITQCSYNLNVSNGIVHGNMFGIGAQRVIECLPKYKLVLGDNITICSGQGKWGYTSNIRCEQVCPTPVHVDGGTIVNSNIMTVFGPRTYYIGFDLDILDSSTVAYQCDTYRRMYGSSTITCLSRYWSPHPTCSFTYRHSCSNDHDCLEPGLICSEGACRCNVGQCYSYTDRHCRDKCPGGLATTFQKTSNKALLFGDSTSVGGVGRSECQSRCLSETSFACKGINFGTYNLLFVTYLDCVLLNEYPADGILTWTLNYDYYQRDCE